MIEIADVFRRFADDYLTAHGASMLAALLTQPHPQPVVLHEHVRGLHGERGADARHSTAAADHRRQRARRAATADLRHVIPPASNVVILSFTFPNSRPFGVAVRYYLWQLDLPEQQIAIHMRWDDRDLATVTSLAARGQVDYLINQDADGSMDKATDTLGLPRLNHELVLFVWQDDAWRPLKSRPIPTALIRSES